MQLILKTEGGGTMNQMKSLENRKLSFKNLLSEVPEYACVVVLVIVLIVAGCVSPVFFTDTNIQNVLKQGAVLAVLSIEWDVVDFRLY